MTGHTITIREGTPRRVEGLPPQVYQALCSCGWAGSPYMARPAAEADGEAHALLAEAAK